jgi:hypothetical protein
MEAKEIQIKPKSNRVLVGLTLSLTLAFSSNTKATLTLNDNGLGVYDSGLNVTWTQDANLLGTLEGVYQSTSYNTVVNAVIAADPTINYMPNANANSGSVVYNLSTSDFGSGGLVDWWAAQAYVQYLNSQNFGGSSQWALPSTPSNGLTGIGYNSTESGQLGELFYKQLNGIALSPMPSGPFSNVQYSAAYWSGTEFAYPYSAWSFYTVGGGQGASGNDMYFQSYAWAVSPGNLAAVPLPAAFWLFGSALAGYIGFNRHKPKNSPVT